MKIKTHGIWTKGLFAAFLFLCMSGCAIFHGKSTPSQYATDAGVTAQIKAKLVQSDSLSAPTVHVETQNGVVQISGFVSNRAQISEATKIARSVQGVQNVVNDLRISKRRDLRQTNQYQ